MQLFLLFLLFSFSLAQKQIESSGLEQVSIVVEECKDSGENCAELKTQGFCDKTEISLVERQTLCGLTCNLCGNENMKLNVRQTRPVNRPAHVRAARPRPSAVHRPVPARVAHNPAVHRPAPSRTAQNPAVHKPSRARTAHNPAAPRPSRARTPQRPAARANPRSARKPAPAARPNPPARQEPIQKTSNPKYQQLLLEFLKSVREPVKELTTNVNFMAKTIKQLLGPFMQQESKAKSKLETMFNNKQLLESIQLIQNLSENDLPKSDQPNQIEQHQSSGQQI